MIVREDRCKARAVAWLVLAVSLIGGSDTGWAYVGTPVLVPTNPIAGETVSVEIEAGGCDAFIDDDADTDIIYNGDNILLVIDSISATDVFCFWPVFTYTYIVDTFPPGNYVLQVDRTYENFVSEIIVETLGVLSFTVTSATPTVTPTAVPSLNLYGLLGLTLAMLVSTGVMLRRRSVGLSTIGLIALMILSPAIQAQSIGKSQYIEVLLAESDTLTPETVVHAINSRDPQFRAVWPSLTAENPQQAFSLLPLRASGDFLFYLQSNPQSTRARDKLAQQRVTFECKMFV